MTNYECLESGNILSGTELRPPMVSENKLNIFGSKAIILFQNDVPILGRHKPDIFIYSQNMTIRG